VSFPLIAESSDLAPDQRILTFCLAAGTVTTKKAVKIICGLKLVGICHVTFKPGSVDGNHKWSALQQQIRTLLLSCSGLVAVLEVTTHLKISISPFSQPTQVFTVMTTLPLLWGSDFGGSSAL